MGIDMSFGIAFFKSQAGAGQILPSQGKVFISVNDRDKPKIVDVAKGFVGLGFELLVTRGTGEFLKKYGIKTKVVNKVYEGRPNILDMIKNQEVDLVINTKSGKLTVKDSSSLRRATLLYNIPYTTTVAAAKAMVSALTEIKNGKGYRVCSIQEYYKGI